MTPPSLGDIGRAGAVRALKTMGATFTVRYNFTTQVGCFWDFLGEGGGNKLGLVWGGIGFVMFRRAGAFVPTSLL